MSKLNTSSMTLGKVIQLHTPSLFDNEMTIVKVPMWYDLFKKLKEKMHVKAFSTEYTHHYVDITESNFLELTL